jgi:hypothetical protein
MAAASAATRRRVRLVRHARQPDLILASGVIDCLDGIGARVRHDIRDARAFGHD